MLSINEARSTKLVCSTCRAAAKMHSVKAVDIPCLHLMLLQRLVLSHNALGDAGITTLSEALQHNTSLRHLDISNTQPTEKSVISLAVTLADQNRSLTSLRLASPLLQQRPQQDTTTHLAHMLARNSSLQELQLSKAGLTDDALECLVQYGLLRGGAVQRLDLSANRFSSLAGALMRHYEFVRLAQGAAGRMQH